MSKGSPFVGVRVPQDLLDWMDAVCRESVEWKHDEPYTRSSLIIDCLRERQNKKQRRKASQERKAARRRAAAETEIDQVEE